MFHLKYADWKAYFSDPPILPTKMISKALYTKKNFPLHSEIQNFHVIAYFRLEVVKEEPAQPVKL